MDYKIVKAVKTYRNARHCDCEYTFVDAFLEQKPIVNEVGCYASIRAILT